MQLVVFRHWQLIRKLETSVMKGLIEILHNIVWQALLPYLGNDRASHNSINSHEFAD